MPKTDTRNQILKYIEQQSGVRVKDLVDHFQISSQIIHRHLNVLLREGNIIKRGFSPRVYYFSVENNSFDHEFNQLNLLKKDDFLENNWLTIEPTGNILRGTDGFFLWCKERGFDFNTKRSEYLSVFDKYAPYRKNGYIDATEKFREIFSNISLDKAFYLDFYSYEIFGRTKWGSLVLYAKLNEDKNLMREVFVWAKPKIESIIRKYNIDCIGFIPHSLRRRTPFLPNLQKFLNLPLPVISFLKITGEISVPQKTLRKASERIQNAKETIFLEQQTFSPGKRLLLIDDAVGSGATLQITAEKCKKIGIEHIYGLALVGSIKGFEVIAEV